MKSLYEKSLFLGDIHVPFHDIEAIAIVYRFIDWFRPHFIFLVGDCVDFYQISKFEKSPQRMLKLQDDLDDTKVILSQLRALCPRSKIIYFEGNHERRLTRWLWSHPEVAQLRAMDIRNLLGLEELKIQFIQAIEQYDFHGFQIEHGEIVRQQSAYTARGQLDKRGVSGISGHSHRLGTHYLTNMAGDHIWIENGCLCDRNPEYVKCPNWQVGFTLGYYKRDDERFSVEQICITGGKAAFAGKEFLP